MEIPVMRLMFAAAHFALGAAGPDPANSQDAPGPAVTGQPSVSAERMDVDHFYRRVHTKQQCIDEWRRHDPTLDTEIWCRDFDGNLVFQITNQSPSSGPLDFLISVDGKRIIDKTMPFDDGHHVEMIPMQVPPGRHVILVESINGQVKHRRSIVLKDRLYVDVSFWYYTRRDAYGPVKRHFEIRTSFHPFSIQ